MAHMLGLSGSEPTAPWPGKISGDRQASSLILSQDPYVKETLVGTPNKELQEYGRNKIGIYLAGSLPS